jgi:hypothetical protein
LSRSYQIVLTDRAERDFRRLDRPVQLRIVNSLQQLATDPRHHP